jgi:hypothetical protein
MSESYVKLLSGNGILTPYSSTVAQIHKVTSVLFHCTASTEYAPMVAYGKFCERNGSRRSKVAHFLVV